MRTFKTEGIIIKRRNYGEADRLVTVFTEKHGKLVVKATGVRRITSRRSPHIEPLNYSVLSFYKGRTYPVLIEASVKEDYSRLKNDLKKVGLAFHLCELIDGLCPEWQEYESVYRLFKQTLDQLANGYTFSGLNSSEKNNNLDKIEDAENTNDLIHGFEVELLSTLGYWHGTPEMSSKLNTGDFIENIIERRLKSKRIFSKIE